jgi:hypothetical protein
MQTATDVANALVNYFLSTGRFEDVSAAAAAQGVMPASAAGAAWQQELGPFAGLAVRAVGVAEEPEPTCYVYVTRASKKLENTFEGELDGVTLRVRKIGRVLVRPEAALSSTNKGHAFRRGGKIACGSSIAPTGAQHSGTLGAFLRDEKGLLALSNNHVIGGCNHTPIGQQITSPSGPDTMAGGPAITQFATMESLVELRSGDLQFVPTQRSDAAVARVTSPKLITSWQGDFFDTPTSLMTPSEGLVVEKVGRTTGHTKGVVESRIIAMMPVPYKDRRFSAVVNYSRIWTVKSTSLGDPFALPGDSGSLVVTENGKAAVGLLFAVGGNGDVAFITDLQDVLRDLGGGLKLASGL